MKNIFILILLLSNLVFVALSIFLHWGSSVAEQKAGTEYVSALEKLEKLESVVLAQYKTIASLPANLPITKNMLDENGTGYIEVQTPKGSIYFNVVGGKLLEVQ